MKDIDNLVTNELLFRKRNEALVRVAEFHDKLQKLDFYCECSDISCRQIIAITADKYVLAHDNSQRLIMKNGHENSKIEYIVCVVNDYIVVESEVMPRYAR